MTWGRRPHIWKEQAMNRETGIEAPRNDKDEVPAGTWHAAHGG
jgi:hypothetical protein